MQSTRTTTLIIILFGLLPLECCSIQYSVGSVTWKPIRMKLHINTIQHSYINTFLSTYDYTYAHIYMPLSNEKNPCSLYSHAVWTLVLPWALNCWHDIAQESVVDNNQSTRTISLAFLFLAQLSTKCSKWAIGISQCLASVVVHHALNGNHYI